MSGLDRSKIVADLAAAHAEALAASEADLARRWSPAAAEGTAALKKLVARYQAMRSEPFAASAVAVPGSIVTVRMGRGGEVRDYFVHDGFRVDPTRWSLQYGGALLGDPETFRGLRVGDAFETTEGRSGEGERSVNRVVAIS
jgi:hypothetical protein